MFENKVLRRMFEPKGEEVRGGVKKRHKQAIRDLCSALDVIRVNKAREIRRAMHGVRMREKKNTHRIIVGKPESQNPLERSRQR
jgi:hypothetical protein